MADEARTYSIFGIAILVFIILALSIVSLYFIWRISSLMEKISKSITSVETTVQQEVKASLAPLLSNIAEFVAAGSAS